MPSIGRGGQRATVPHGVPFEQKLKSYYLQVDSSPDFFVRSIPSRFRRDNGLYGRHLPEKIYLVDLHWSLQYKYIISKLYGNYSLHFQRKLTYLLKEGKLRTIRQWFYTANGVVLPFLIEGNDDHEVVDRLTKYSLEGCATNYAHFISSLKKTKKLMRKFSALNGLEKGVRLPNNGSLRQHIYYVLKFNDGIVGLNRREKFRSLLLWTQSRATGLCDSSMIKASLDKFRATVTEPCQPLAIDAGILQSCIRTGNVTGHEAVTSVGPKACLQSPQKPGIALKINYLKGTRRDEVGGQTRYLLYLASHNVLKRRYDLQTLESELLERPVPVRSSRDLLSWAIQEILHSPKHRAVRFHCVEDQSKARSITVAHYAYQVIMGVFAHALVPAVISAETKTGLSKDRNLWRFLHDQMTPESPAWDGFLNHPILGFSTDLSEATDFGNWWFARAIWSEFIRQTKGRMQPTALMMLARVMYTSPRYVFYRVTKNTYDLFPTGRGFLMGDMFTKIVLTIGQDYNVRKAILDSPLQTHLSNKYVERTVSLKPYNLASLQESGLSDREPERPVLAGVAYSLVGDDVIILYSHVAPSFKMEPYFRQAAETGGWKLSDDDTFDSKHLMFYCEEGALVPSSALNTTRTAIHAGRVVDYLDYPRIRLLLPVKVETNDYSHTNVGRFSLLGRESCWVVDTASQRANDIYRRAVVLQHLVVPRDIETLCPYLPQEIGGDGSYDPDPEFFTQVIYGKAKDIAETLYRIERQLTKTWAHKFVSTDKPRGGVMKQHLILPTLDRLESWIPEKSRIYAPSKEHAEILSALPKNILESPQVTFFKLVKRVYNAYLFRGILLPNLMVKADVSSKRGMTDLSVMERSFDRSRYETYLEHWRRPGFSYRNMEPYFVVPYRHADIMSVGWNWKFRPERPSEVARIDIHTFLDTILYGKDVNLVVDRLNLFFESDPLLMIRVRENNHIHGVVNLVSKDKKLAYQICKWIRQNRRRDTVVNLVDPVIFFYGRIEEIPPGILLQDAGSISYFNRNAYRTNFVDSECGELLIRHEPKYPGVTSYLVKSFYQPPPRPKVLTEGPTIGEVQNLAFAGQTAVRQFMDVLFDNPMAVESGIAGFQYSLVGGQQTHQLTVTPPGQSPIAGASDDLPNYSLEE